MLLPAMLTPPRPQSRGRGNEHAHTLDDLLHVGVPHGDTLFRLQRFKTQKPEQRLPRAFAF